jgi:anhydro-N-acetylmuramic acid kinase
MTERYLGLISGTSADGIDVALARFDPEPRLEAALTAPYPEALRRRILALAQSDGDVALDELAALDVEIGHCFAAAALALLQRERLDRGRVAGLGCHGQTVRHRPHHAPPFTLQLGDPNVIAERTGITTVADFRRRDLAAGGEGAPLAPLLHAALFPPDADRPCAVLNLGGIANLTVLPSAADEPVRGFDTGPGNCLLDAWAERQLGTPYDRDGALAAAGRVDPALLAELLGEPFFHAAPPKSTGREQFHLPWLARYLDDRSPTAADVQATLVALTARSVAEAVQRHAPATRRVWVCGGGVHNPVLLGALARALAPIPVASTAARGIDPDFVEALLFAWLARERLAGRALHELPAITGARGPRVLGGVYFGA